MLFECATKGYLQNPLLTKIIDEIDVEITKKDIALDSISGELWQQLQDFRK